MDPQLLAELEEYAGTRRREQGWATHSTAPSGTARRVWHIKPGWVKALERSGEVAFTETPTRQTPWWELTRHDLAPAHPAERSPINPNV